MRDLTCAAVVIRVLLLLSWSERSWVVPVVFALSMRRAASSQKDKPLYSDSDEDDDALSRRSIAGPFKVNVSHGEFSGTGTKSADVGLDVASGSKARLSDLEQLRSASGFHSIDLLDESVNLPDHVRDNNTTLTFPEKVSYLKYTGYPSTQLYASKTKTRTPFSRNNFYAVNAYAHSR